MSTGGVGFGLSVEPGLPCIGFFVGSFELDGRFLLGGCASARSVMLSVWAGALADGAAGTGALGVAEAASTGLTDGTTGARGSSVPVSRDNTPPKPKAAKPAIPQGRSRRHAGRAVTTVSSGGRTTVGAEAPV